ncbi:hypothetical protein GCM10009681_18850 [Luedemannella helvata]|uniref:Ricin B lectin domain-containing protein n=1 Tax=Luedemannella helvata TaxID=349315 RepID=A0ABN2K400_9ACTN
MLTLAPAVVGPPAYAARGTVAMQQNYRTGLCLAPAGAHTRNNTVIVQYFCDADPTRFWEYVATRDDPEVFYIRNDSTGKCLTPAGGHRDAGEVIVQFVCDDHPSRWWKREWLTSTRYRIVNPHSGLCMSARGATMFINKPIELAECDDRLSRQWQSYISPATEQGRHDTRVAPAPLG